MENEKPIFIKFKKKYEKAENFQRYYITGAIGGFKNPYDFRLTFYNVDSNDFTIKSEHLKNDKSLSREDLISKLEEIKMPHLLQCEIIMSKQAATEIYNFLKKELTRVEELEKSPMS